MLGDSLIDKIGNIKIPKNLSSESKEESIYEHNEAPTHQEHKVREGTEQALELAKQQIRTLQINNDDLAQLGPHRRLYSWWILGFSIFFIISVLVVLILASYQVALSERELGTMLKLDNEVLITLLATNTVQVVGLLFIVAKWLFPSIDRKKDRP
ncbi:MAG: hypothetical protein Q9M19_08560 [Mariprofundaceae bacterium]|nr:hypothetical protein [Mariprofundaceae bacterium]